MHYNALAANRSFLFGANAAMFVRTRLAVLTSVTGLDLHDLCQVLETSLFHFYSYRVGRRPEDRAAAAKSQ